MTSKTKPAITAERDRLRVALRELYDAYCAQMHSEYDYPGNPWTPDRDGDKAALMARDALIQTD